MLLALSFVCAPLQADPQSLQRLQDKLQGMHAFQASFTQTVIDGGGSMLQSTLGDIAVKRPGLLHWQTAAPFEQLLVSDGIKLWSYDADLEQVTVQAVAQYLSQGPALLLSGDVDNLAASYEINDAQRSDNIWQFQLVPKAPDSLFEQISLTFADNTLLQMDLLDSLGQRSSLAFSEIKINPLLDDAMFTFVPPQGVDIIAQ
jgi:outer membrane lipoprotein carrier protein